VSAQHAPLLAMRGISKRFPGVVALEDVSLELERGQVLALMGENGAGKSTLMKVLGGALQPDAGEIRISGQAVALSSVGTAQRLGVALVHQELMLAPNLDLAANLFLGNEPGGRGSLRALRRSMLAEQAQALLERIGLSLPPSCSCWSSPRRWRSRRASSSWMSRPRRSPGVSRSTCSGSFASWRPRAWASSTSRTG
jgi:ribose transport system ATP-binding protein